MPFEDEPVIEAQRVAEKTARVVLDTVDPPRARDEVRRRELRGVIG